MNEKSELGSRCLSAVFIGGTGRSGTTILKKALVRHEEIVAIRDELRVITDPGGALDLETALSSNWSQYNGDVALHRFRDIVLACCRSRTSVGVRIEKVERAIFRKFGIAPRRYLGAGFAEQFGRSNMLLALDQLTDALSRHHSAGSWAGSKPLVISSKIFETTPLEPYYVRMVIADFFRGLYGLLPGGQDASVWLDDTPPNILHADRLLQLFPEMKLLHIFRDPRDVVASYAKHSWGGDSIVDTANRVAAILDRWELIRCRLPSDVYFEVSLEELGACPATTLRKICEFLGIGFRPHLGGTAFDRMNSGRWKTDLSPDEQSAVNEVLSRHILSGEFG